MKTLKKQIKDHSTCEEEKRLRESLLEKLGTYVYENWFAACGWCSESGKLTHSSDFVRSKIYEKYGIKVADVSII